MVARLNEVPGISCATPGGAIYAFPDISGTGLSSREFGRFVLEQAGVALTPGVFFGANGENHVRLCYLRDPAIIEAACANMKAALGGRKNAASFA